MKLSGKEMMGVRGGEISMILQDPMQSLNPLFTIGNQVGEAANIHLGLKGKALHARIIDALKKVRIPAAESRRQGLPAPALRRHAPARRWRDQHFLGRRR